MEHNSKQPSWPVVIVVLLSPVIGMALGVGTTVLFQVQHTNYSNLVVNLFFLGGCYIPVRFLKYSRRNLGLKVIDEELVSHALVSLVVFSFYILVYIFVFRISGFKSFTSDTAWGLVTIAVVVFSEEVYFRGIVYSFIERRYSNISALIVSSIIFGLLHATQGLGGIVSKAFAGWLWGSVRYSTGMIFLLIFPIHFSYNAIWLLFEGNWNTPPAWATYVLPALEFLLGLFIVLIKNRRFLMRKETNKITS